MYCSDEGFRCILTISSGNLGVYGNLSELAGVPETLKIIIEMMMMVTVMVMMMVVRMMNGDGSLLDYLPIVVSQVAVNQLEGVHLANR